MDEESKYVDYIPDLVTYNSNLIKSKEYETNSAKYLILNSDEDPIYNSIIACPETKKILCFSPPLSSTMEEFKEKNSEITDDIVVNEIVEGTMVNLFYDPRIQSWELATKGAIGGKYWFYRNQYSVGKYKNMKQPTFREMFLDVFQTKESDDINDISFLEYIPKEYSYSFILQHPTNHIVKKIESPVLYLVAVYHLLENRVVSIPMTVFEEWDCFLGVRGLIEFPSRFDEDSYSELYEIQSKTTVDKTIVGLMFYNLKTGMRTSMENESYKVLRELRGNNPNLQYHYLMLRRNTGKVDEFLKAFPQYKGIFYEFYKQYNDFVTQIHQSYITYYVKKSGERVSKKYFPLVYKLHHELFLPSLIEPNEKLIIRKAVVSNFIQTVELKSLIFYLNYTE